MYVLICTVSVDSFFFYSLLHMKTLYYINFTQITLNSEFLKVCYVQNSKSKKLFFLQKRNVFYTMLTCLTGVLEIFCLFGVFQKVDHKSCNNNKTKNVSAHFLKLSDTIECKYLQQQERFLL